MNDRKRNMLSQKDFRKLGDWVLANRGEVEKMQPEAIAAAASQALGLTVTHHNATAACECVDVLTAKETVHFTGAKVAELHSLIDSLRRELTAVRRDYGLMRERIEWLESKELANENKKS